MLATIAALFVYPVKSCRGIALREARMTERGIAHDREWLIIDASDRFITQRDMPRLALITTTLSGTGLQLGAPGQPDLAIEFDREGPRRSVTVWRDTLPAIDQGDAAARWLSQWIGAPVRLVRFDRDAKRMCNPDFAGPGGAHHAFADGYPVLVLSKASLDDLNRRLDAPLPVNRFRPNLLLSGIEAHDEDHVATIEVGSVKLRLVKPCTRCQITTTDQASGVVGVEPLPTLAQYRYNAALDGVTFGMNAIVEAGAGATIATGARVDCTLTF
ncbi:MAG: MOSC N-terminal beta barrel domain-containing protein [Casimicrobiaceae bacterium]